MSNFVVSARKYRPIRFDSVVGQQHVSQTLKNAIQSDHLAQAFLFCGPRGVGKTTCARILAKVLNCESPTSDTEPCDECPSCKAFNKNTSLNIHELDAASNNSVEHIRSLIEQVRFAPQSGQYKIYIIDEVHMLSQAAFNAFLKTLEEPPSYAIFILATTEKHKIIPTILSRCQIFDFNRIQVPDMVSHLQKICIEEGIEAEEEALNIIAQKADGALRDSLSIFDRIVSFSGKKIIYQDVIENLNILDYDYFFKVVDAIVSEDSANLLALFDNILRKGFDGDIFMNGLALHFRNLLVCQDERTIPLLEVSGNIKERYAQQSKLVPSSIILSALSIINDCDVNYKMAYNKRLHVELALIRMAHIQRAIHAQTLIATAPNTEKKNADNQQTVVLQEEKAPYTPKTSTEPVKTVEKTYTPTPVEKKDTTPIPTEETPPPKDENESAAEKAFTKSKFAKKKGGLLSKLVSEVEDEDSVEETPAIPFTVENMQNLWNKHIDSLESPSTKSLFKAAILNVDTEKEQLHITVTGSRGQDAIDRSNELKQEIKLKFKKPNLEFVFHIEAPSEEEIAKNKKPQKPHTDKQKYIHFLQMNPALKEFQKRFGLFPPKDKK
ncbi:MAG: DNA polymerase III subunit gamma/tau [Aureispira sp.]|nr:DNA polymerase III subunit gamma/tau [Aureispira sp.]